MKFKQPFQTTSNHYYYPNPRQLLKNHGYALTDCPKLGYGRYSKVCVGIHLRTNTKVIYYHKKYINFELTDLKSRKTVLYFI